MKRATLSRPIGNLFSQLADVVSLFSEIYGSAGLVLFATLTWITSTYFSNLYTQMVVVSYSILNNKQLGSSELVDKRTLVKWKRFHVLLLETIACIERCFGPILVIWIIYFFVNFTSSSFYLVDGIRRFGFDLHRIWPSFFTLIKLSINIFLCTKTPAILCREVFYTILG